MDGETVRLQLKTGRGALVGEGSFADVVRGQLTVRSASSTSAHHRERSITVAVKRFKTRRGEPGGEGMREKVLDEVKVLHRTRHSSRIVRLLALCIRDDDAPPSLVMEYLAGGSVHKHIKRGSSFLAWERRGRRIALDVAEGLLYLHTRRPTIVHRDLRSCNILLTAGFRAKIADLGSAKDQTQTALPSLSVLFNQHAAFPPESVVTALVPGGVRSYKWDVWCARARERGLPLPGVLVRLRLRMRAQTWIPAPRASPADCAVLCTHPSLLPHASAQAVRRPPRGDSHRGAVEQRVLARPGGLRRKAAADPPGQAAAERREHGAVGGGAPLPAVDARGQAHHRGAVPLRVRAVSRKLLLRRRSRAERAGGADWL